MPMVVLHETPMSSRVMIILNLEFAQAAFRCGIFGSTLLVMTACGDSDALSKLRDSAKAGNSSAQHNLALMLPQEPEDRRDYTAALEWYKKAAAQGVVLSAYNLSVIYWTGNARVHKNQEEACQWFRQAAEA